MMQTIILFGGIGAFVLPSIGQVSPVITVVSRAETLRGIDSVDIVVEECSECRELGISTLELKTAVELRFRQFGIAVQPTEVNDRSLVVAVTILKPQPSGLKLPCAYMISLAFWQRVRLDNYLSATEVRVADCITWSGGGVFVEDTERMDESIKKNTLNGIDLFINDYLSVNPRTVNTQPSRKEPNDQGGAEEPMNE